FPYTTLFRNIQPLNSGGYRDGGCNHPIGQQGCSANHGGKYQPGSLSFYQCEEREDTALSLTIGAKHDDHIVDGCLQGQDPEDTGEPSQNKLRGNQTIGDDGFENIKRRSSDIPENYTKTN